ncbi:response regulator transcription factor [Streptomyces thinghirensis]|uniref:Response regulator transcription factor n=1 Tax=Streptomyces thinghirensis TaxID=551547 RepID=A0ABP9SVZ4_9ACTN
MIRVLIVDDELLLRSCMQQILESEPDITVPDTCDGAEAARAIARHRPDVVLLDLKMPVVDGLSVLRQLPARRPGGYRPATAMLTTFSKDEDILEALRAGADGFLLKDSAPDQLAHSVKVLADGGTVLSPAVARSVIGGYVAGAARGPQEGPRAAGGQEAESLTERERQVLARLAEGLPNAEIARGLQVSTHTVRDHVSMILAKLGVENRVQAAVTAWRLGLAPAPRRT